MKSVFSLFLIVLTIQLVVSRRIPNRQNTTAATYLNPIIDSDSGDPQAIFINGFYYLTSTQYGIRVYKSAKLTDFRNAEVRDVLPPPPGFEGIWAPELHLIQGQLYIYFCMQVAGQGWTRRNYVIKADDSNNPFGSWGPPIVLSPEFEFISIDGTVLQHGNGRLYFVWATTESSAFDSPLRIYIAEMVDPVTVGPYRKLLRMPTADWECRGGCVNEGPFFFYSQGVSYLVFSASSTWDPNYGLGLMSVPGHLDPMELNNWWYGPSGLVFWRNDEESVFTTGHAGFVQSPDGSQLWMTYHATQTMEPGEPRLAYVDKITFEANGFPIFPRPSGRNHPMPIPSGQIEEYGTCRADNSFAYLLSERMRLSSNKVKRCSVAPSRMD